MARRGKTVDHVLFADSATRAATNAEQWYVTVSRGRKSVRIFTTDKAQLAANIRRAGHRELALDLAPPPQRSRRVREQILRGVHRGREFARRVCMMMSRRAWSPAASARQVVTPPSMRNRSTATTVPDSTAPACWQREGPSECLRVELPSGELHLFSYRHFNTASLKRGDTGTETLQIAFSSQDLEVEGCGLRELLLGLQDFAIKWLRTAPARYHTLPTSAEGIVTAVRITAVE